MFSGLLMDFKNNWTCEIKNGKAQCNCTERFESEKCETDE